MRNKKGGLLFLLFFLMMLSCVNQKYNNNSKKTKKSKGLATLVGYVGIIASVCDEDEIEWNMKEQGHFEICAIKWNARRWNGAYEGPDTTEKYCTEIQFKRDNVILDGDAGYCMFRIIVPVEQSYIIRFHQKLKLTDSYSYYTYPEDNKYKFLIPIFVDDSLSNDTIWLHNNPYPPLLFSYDNYCIFDDDTLKIYDAYLRLKRKIVLNEK